MAEAKTTETKPKTTKTATVKTAPKGETKALVEDKRIAELQAKVDEQSKQLEAQLQQMQMLMTLLQQNQSQQAKEEEEDELEDVPVVNLVPCKLNLIGADGRAMYTFHKMYEEQYIDFSDLKEIIKSKDGRRMARNGRFYILNERAVDKLRLKNDYRKILNPEQLQTLLKHSVDYVVELYKLAPEGQQKVILDMIKEKKYAGEKVDLNILQELGEVAGVDLINIEPIE